MKVTFVSNYFNHHQRELCEELYKITNNNFTFISTSQMRQERKNLGYGETDIPGYVKHAYEENNAEISQKIIDEADVVIFGSAPENMLKNRLKSNKLIFRYSERPLKNGREIKNYLPHLLLWHMRNPINKPIYLLCAGAFTYADYHSYGLFSNRSYKWGYFPVARNYENIDKLICDKVSGSILWCGRFIDWKHPEIPVKVAKRLKENNYSFKLNLIGSGMLKDSIEQMIKREGLEDCVEILGPMKPDEVRAYMERSEVFLFTSDRKEGWGAVLNEAMNSGCAVVASHIIGSVPYLLENNKSGFICESCNTDEFFEKTKMCFDNVDLRVNAGKTAYKVIKNEWNAHIAARALINLAEDILSGNDVKLPKSGPCSRAAILKDDWWKN